MGVELDSTQQSFPPYGELTQTKAWAAKTPLVHTNVDEATAAVEVSHGSRYTEGAELGRGGMGRVVLARDTRVGRDVAVKVLHPERELEPEERSRFLREAQVQGQLEHPSIVPVYDIERRPDGTTFFTMRRVLGRTLSAILDDLRTGVPAAKARYTQRELLTAFSTVCLTIDYAHSRGVVHRDIKPANIMLGDFGEVYVLDWGLARLVDDKGESSDKPQERLSMPGAFLGTPMYMAPEQMADPDVAPVADVYSLGLILFEILTLERCRDPNALFAPVNAKASVRTPHRDVPPELEAVCVRATEMEPSARYSTPRAMQEAINRYLEGDREHEARRQLAAKHMDAARIALGKAAGPNADFEKYRGRAITDLGRALALDPGNTEYLALLGELMNAQTSQTPAAVVQQIEDDNQRVIHAGAKHSATAIVSWWLFLPILLWLGIRDAWQMWLIGVPVTVSALIGLVMVRQKRIGNGIQIVAIFFMLLATMAVSRIYGPFVLLPTLICTYAIVLQAHPTRMMRIAGAVIATIAITVPALLEWMGALPASYRFEDGAWKIVPQLVDLPKTGTNVFLIAANLAMIIVPCLFIAKLRDELSRAQIRLAVQAWHWQNLGAQLIGRPEATRP
ncbi:MAG TPA: serine/threonine-protein kinase [Kofleriaceae bacterium]|nr:serine/threonine-protein kinase [Kofleriaceae bacterium]